MLSETLKQIVSLLKKKSVRLSNLLEEADTAFFLNENMDLEEEKLLERIYIALDAFDDIEALMRVLDINVVVENVTMGMLEDFIAFHEEQITFVIEEQRTAMNDLFIDRIGNCQFCALAHEIEGLPEETWAK
ncbi:hypothetical protein ACFL08_03930 [Patescibacteria group bacterium]